MFGSSHNQWPVVSCYETALARYHATKPIRGRMDDVRPLRCDRRQPDVASLRTMGRIRMRGESVVIRLYHTDQLVYHPDGVIEVDSTWIDGRFTLGFVNAVLRIRLFKAAGWVWHNDIPINDPRSAAPLSFRQVDGLWEMCPEWQGVPLRRGRKYAPAYKELGRRVRLWHRQYRSLLRWVPADEFGMSQAKTFNILQRLEEIELDESGHLPTEVALQHPPLADMTGQYRRALGRRWHPDTTATVVSKDEYRRLLAEGKVYED